MVRYSIGDLLKLTGSMWLYQGHIAIVVGIDEVSYELVVQNVKGYDYYALNQINKHTTKLMYKEEHA